MHGCWTHRSLWWYTLIAYVDINHFFYILQMRLQELLGIGEQYIYENCILYFIAFLDMSNLCLKRGDQSEIAIVSSIYIAQHKNRSIRYFVLILNIIMDKDGIWCNWWFWFGLWCLTPLSTIFQLYHWSVLLLEATGVLGENHQPTASHWQTFSHNVASSTPRHERCSISQI